MTILALDSDSPHILDNPAWAALTGPHAHFAERRGHAIRYHPDVAPFHAVSDEARAPGTTSPHSSASAAPPRRGT